MLVDSPTYVEFRISKTEIEKSINIVQAYKLFLKKIGN